MPPNTRMPPPQPQGGNSNWAALVSFDFIGRRNIAFALSGLSVLVFWVWVLAAGGLNYGIDFTGGIRHIFKFNQPSSVELLGRVREAALAVDPSAQVQTIGKEAEGEVVIQVKGFELMEKASAAVRGAPVSSVDDLKSRLAGMILFDETFYSRVIAETNGLETGRLLKNISDHVNTTTAGRLAAELERRFGSPGGQIDLNQVPTSDRLLAFAREMALRRLARDIAARIPSAQSIEDLNPLLRSAGLDPGPLENKFLLRAPTLEEIKFDLREYAGRPEDLAAVLKDLYPDAFSDEFGPPIARLIAGKESRGFYKSALDALQRADIAPASLLGQILSESAYTGAFVLIKTDQVSSRIGAELRQKAVVVILLSLLAMLAYIWIRFEFRFGVGAVVTLLHDALTVIPLMSVLGYEYDINLIAAILTLIGYSLNDTIVVYDRIRENLAAMRGADLKHVLNTSIAQTLSRTVVTGVTTLLAVLSLFFFGGPVLEGFSLSLFVGILVGTYSSIFVSSPIVYLWPTKR